MKRHAEPSQDKSALHETTARQLYLLVGVFITSLMLILSLSFVFSQLISELDKKEINERARLFIGEDIVRKINLIERDFYRIVATRNDHAREIIAQDIIGNVSGLDDNVRVLQFGGTVRQTILLNIDNVDQMVREASYQPDPLTRYTLDVIEITPQLEQIRNDTSTLLALTKIIATTHTPAVESGHEQTRRELDNFLTSIPHLFHRLNENANRLFYTSGQEIARIESELASKRSQYTILEVTLITLIILFTIIFTRTSVQQINAANARLGETLTAMRAARDEAEHMATHDILCGLPNRILLESRLQQAIARSQRTGCVGAVAFLDLDGFKSINDQHGHDVGDLLLIAVSRCLSERLRSSDTVSRFGGDEFIILIDDLAQADQANIVMEKLFSCLRTNYHIGQKQFYVTASCGVAIFPHDGMDSQTLIKRADTAMYRAKALGRNRFCFYESAMTEELVTSVE
ncbi:MAG: GGDEF domain-containing protein [Halothiobacillaceae bacterium]|nr:GGDEF domain-containing protein [Halothiobacillaceae bacterium]